MRAREALMNPFRSLLRIHGLTEQEWRVIRSVSENGASDASTISERCFISMPGLSRTLVSLERKGLVRRKRDLEDQRRANIALTKKGAHSFELISPAILAVNATIAARMPSEKLDSLYKLLVELEQSVSDTTPV
ncbi:MAG: MarR family transcriptional regulator [Candidatus Hydrogenedentes bacterium]|nr:MarR family transcriptional regulator [Candidatus Hydrogenedentota bacterium]